MGNKEKIRPAITTPENIECQLTGHKRYNFFLFEEFLESDRGFHQCLSPNCCCGQLPHRRKAKLQCIECGSETRIFHQTSRHENETYEEHDSTKQNRLFAEKASATFILKHKKICPSCLSPPEKCGGSEDMNCKSPFPERGKQQLIR
ncbi:hypothetical protein BDZ45DRAFT_581891 [Acephala macrosclerotiorum]|nr:hypothetical protein BDZ45DRAFT_581891 [Acephala macrosclerotiorum]